MAKRHLQQFADHTLRSCSNLHGLIRRECTQRGSASKAKTGIAVSLFDVDAWQLHTSKLIKCLLVLVVAARVKTPARKHLTF
jgi:hypothetical protein